LLDKAIECFGVEHCSCRIVGIRDVNDASLRIYRCHNAVQIEAVVVHGNFDQGAARRARHHLVHHERALAGDGVQSWRQQSSGDDIDQRSRAIRNEYLLRLDSVMSG
jgi:hypothetical protein